MDPLRHETEAEKYDRNWAELLQELRIAQTGVQILAALLLTLPFTERFARLDEAYHVLYLVAFASACLTTALLIGPVTAHRVLFGRGEKDVLVHVSARITQVGLVMLASTLVCVVILIFGVVAGGRVAVAAGATMSVCFVLGWLVLPLWLRRRTPTREID